MKPIRYSQEALSTLFQDKKVATLTQLKTALGTAVDLTVFRKLSALPYRTSYSHRASYLPACFAPGRKPFLRLFCRLTLCAGRLRSACGLQA